MCAVVTGRAHGGTEVRQHRPHRGAARQQPGHQRQWAHHPRKLHDTASPHQHTQGLCYIYTEISLIKISGFTEIFSFRVITGWMERCFDLNVS